VQVSEGIHRLTQGVTNFYLIGESGKYTVVDAGTPGDWAYFARSLAGLGAKLADVDAVLLTHAHPDHTGDRHPRGRAGRAKARLTRSSRLVRSCSPAVSALISRGPSCIAVRRQCLGRLSEVQGACSSTVRWVA
jgi:metallo-beta-lactamase superfamily protein